MFKSCLAKEVCILKVYVGDLLVVNIDNKPSVHLLAVKQGRKEVNFLILETNEMQSEYGYDYKDGISFKELKTILNSEDIQVYRKDDYTLALLPIEK